MGDCKFQISAAVNTLMRSSLQLNRRKPATDLPGRGFHEIMDNPFDRTFDEG